jgi:hypothetical protein
MSNESEIADATSPLVPKLPTRGRNTKAGGSQLIYIDAFGNSSESGQSIIPSIEMSQSGNKT